MRLVVDLTKCQGYGQCAFMAPSTFVMDGEEGLHFVAEPPDAERERVLRAAAACPVQAIALELDANGRQQASTAGAADAERVIEGGIVVVGASLAGLRAAETLRREGYVGPLTLVGDEPGEAYDRPPLSKHVLSGLVAPDATLLPRLRELDARRILGVRPPAWIWPRSGCGWATGGRWRSNGCSSRPACGRGAGRTSKSGP